MKGNYKKNYKIKRRITTKGGTRKRIYKKKRFSTYNKTGYVNMGLGFPKKLTMTHRYFETIYFNTTTSVLNVHNFRANGMYDPNQSGVGHQPLYFDQMTALYNHYTVIGSKVTVKWVNMNNSNSVPCFVGIFLNDDTSLTVTNANYMYEQSQSKRLKLLTINSTAVTQTCTFSAKKIFGGQTMSNPRLEGTASADPTEQSYFQLFCQSADGTSTPSIAAMVEITYIAVWKELKDIVSS